MAKYEETVNGHLICGNKWPFTSLMLRKRRLWTLFQSAFLPIISLLDEDEEDKKEDSLVEIFTAIDTAISCFDEEKMKWFINIVLEGVSVDNKEMDNLDIRDATLSGSSGLFYEICGLVLKENLSDFLELIKTRLGFDLLSVFESMKKE